MATGFKSLIALLAAVAVVATAACAGENPTPNPALAADYYERGAAFVELGQYKSAIKDLDKAIKINPDSSSYHSRGRAFDGLGPYQSAIEDYTKAIQLYPYFVMNYVYRSIAYSKLGQHAKADADRARACSSGIERSIISSKLSQFC